MPKFDSLISLGTAGKVAVGVVAGGIGVSGVQHYKNSSEFSKDPQRAEMREEQKKMSFEVQQRSEELEKKERELKTLAENIAKQSADLKDKEAALQRIQQAVTETQGVAAGVVAVETVQQVAQAKEPADEQPEEPKADVVPTNNAPRRPAVFDGSGDKEKPTTKKNDASKPSVVFGSSGDVVTIEKGGAVSDAETELLRKEVERTGETSARTGKSVIGKTLEKKHAIKNG